MSFDTEAVKDGRGRAIRVDVSLDNWATVYARWGDVAGLLDGANQYPSRIVALHPVRRAFGQNRIAASSSTEMVLDNSDGAIDWLCGRESMQSAAAARFKIFIVLYDVLAPATLHAKQLGDFSLSEWPAQENDTLTLVLNDDMLGKAGKAAQLPTIEDWASVGTDENNPLLRYVPGSGSTYDAQYGLSMWVDKSTPIQLAFGEDWVLALPHILTANDTVATISNSGGYRKKLIVPVCCTRDETYASPDTEVTELRVEIANSPYYGGPPTFLLDIPKTIDGVELWRFERSPVITKAGKDFRVIYLVVEPDFCDSYVYDWGGQTEWVIHELMHGRIYEVTATPPEDGNSVGLTQFMDALHMYEYQGGYSGEMVQRQRTAITPRHDGKAAGAEDTRYARIGSRVLGWFVKGYPFSARQNTSGIQQHAVDVMSDMVVHYSEAPSFDVDTVQRTRVKAGTSTSRCAGVMLPWADRAKNPGRYIPPPSMRDALSKLAQSADIDVFIDWDGQLSFSADVRDFTTATSLAALVEVPETKIDKMKRWVPGTGERHSPYNRIVFIGAKTDPASGIAALPFQGPWDMGTGLTTSIDPEDRIVEIKMEQGWRPVIQQKQAPWYWRQLDLVARDRFRFRTSIEGLRLELGQYFKLSWTRGLGGPYVSAVLQCEAISYAAADDTVDIEAVWCDDLQTERGYLLDDETLLVRAKVGSSSLAVDATTLVDASGGSIEFDTMQVEVGDILVIRDSSVPVGSMKRQLARRIVSVDSTQTLHCESLLDPIDDGSTIVNADWYIVRGATTYPIAGTDPTNYPSDGDMYGKVTAAGVYSNSTVGNRLLSG